MARVLIEGSSTAYGLWGGIGGGWADRLKTSLMGLEDRKQFASVVNLAVPLRTLPEIVEDLPANMQRYRGNSPARLGLFMLGMSDSRLVGGQELAVSTEDFRKNLVLLDAICRAHNFRPIYMGLPSFDDSLTRSFGREDDVYLTEERVRYEALVAEHARETGASYVAIANSLAQRYPDVHDILDRDGLHLNALGHAAVHDAVLPLVSEQLATMKLEAKPIEPVV